MGTFRVQKLRWKVKELKKLLFLKLVILEPCARLQSVSIWQAEVELLALRWNRLPRYMLKDF